jgi:hypothetical protein
MVPDRLSCCPMRLVTPGPVSRAARQARLRLVGWPGDADPLRAISTPVAGRRRRARRHGHDGSMTLVHVTGTVIPGGDTGVPGRHCVPGAVAEEGRRSS